eukprot:TRINITY_DN4487_c0_g1_i8.p4 TRINITY_DN4487_c0_g1~~TRINITY_DN4487_c0_g1_i8.p4  ORF type:complete len:166 (-),score=17.46 TRINITY_DN4487_c0_g1_i8:601-1098(-)
MKSLKSPKIFVCEILSDEIARTRDHLLLFPKITVQYGLYKLYVPVPDVQVGENRDDNTTNNNNKRLKVLSVSDYRVVSQIDRGRFAEVFKVESVKNPGCFYAMKLSKKMPANTSQSDFNKYASYSFYMKERKAYKRLIFSRKDANGDLAMDYGIPKIYEKGSQQG